MANHHFVEADFRPAMGGRLKQSVRQECAEIANAILDGGKKKRTSHKDVVDAHKLLNSEPEIGYDGIPNYTSDD